MSARLETLCTITRTSNCSDAVDQRLMDYALSGDMTQLSKSRFLSGLQCPLKLWYDVHNRELATPPDETKQAIFDRGTAIGELAQQRWPGGELVGFRPWERETAIAETRTLMADPTIPAIYEAAIEHRGVFIRVDILARNDDGWDLVEVKASASPEKAVFQNDVAVQHWVATGAGLAIRQAGILVLNRDYIYPGGEYDLDELFTFFDSTEQCLSAAGRIEEDVDRLHATLGADAPPEIGIGDHCFTPYDCPYYAHCSRDAVFPEHPIGNLHRLHHARRAQLEAMGVETIAEIPNDFPLNDTQQRIRKAVLTGRPWQSDQLQQALSNVDWPLYYLDFEAFQPALPLFPGTRPFQAIPFQYSLHIEHEDGRLEHVEYLHTENTDPRLALARSLLDAIGNRGSIVVYSSYERRMLNELAQACPERASELTALIDRLWDLLPVIQQHYYHPDFNGSFSIKAVLPALVPDSGWSDMAISDGMAAAAAYERALQDCNGIEARQIFAELCEYCHMDTKAMVDLRHELLRLAVN